LVGKLIFLTSVILNIAVVVNLMSRYMQRPQEPHLKTTKSNLWYLKGTINIGLFHRRGIGLAFTKFINFGMTNVSIMPIYCDNESYIKIAMNPIYHSKTKHFTIHLKDI
ncbi:hypothetical protein BDL97_03G099800, partial [Sphagnum fallax]